MTLDTAESKGLAVFLLLATVVSIATYMIVLRQSELDCLSSMADQLCYESMRSKAGKSSVYVGVIPNAVLYLASLVIYRGVRQ